MHVFFLCLFCCFIWYAEHCRFEENEAMWAKIKAEILGESDSDDDEDGGDDDDDEEGSDGQEGDNQGQPQSQMTQQV